LDTHVKDFIAQVIVGGAAFPCFVLGTVWCSL